MGKIVGLVSLVASVLGILAYFGIEGAHGDDRTGPVACNICPAPTPPPPSDAPDPRPPSPAPPEPHEATCSIEDVLADGQVAELVKVSIDGSSVGTLLLDDSSPHGSVPFSVVAGEEHDYAIASVTTVADFDGEKSYQGGGDGTITCVDGGVFRFVIADDTTDPWEVSLEVVG